MRSCIISPEQRFYDESTEFVSYSLQRHDGSRCLVLQFVRGGGGEQFALITLSTNSQAVFAAAPGSGDREFTASYNIVNEGQVASLLVEEGSAYALNIVPKDHLEAILHSFEAISVVRASGAVQALTILCGPVKQLTGIEINPIELTLQVAERFSQKKAEGRCCIM